MEERGERSREKRKGGKGVEKEKSGKGGYWVKERRERRNGDRGW